MPVTDVTKDLDNRTLTITARFAAPVERVWAIYADPRQLEQIWGPPGYPATFVDHDLREGSRVTYFMTGPNGEKYPGYWLVTGVDEHRSLTFDDGFADEDFNPDPTMALGHNRIEFTADGDATIVTCTTVYDSAEDLQAVLDMGMAEGATLAMNQIDGLLAAG